MPIEHAIRSSEELLKHAKALFGDVVSEAYITTHYNEDLMTIEMAEENITKRRKFSFNDEGEIGFDDSVIVLVINGRHIAFSSSEWGGMGPFDMKTAVEI